MHNYHYCAERSLPGGGAQHIDGIVGLVNKVLSMEGYRVLKSKIQYNVPSLGEDFTLISFSYLGTDDVKQGG